MPQEVRLRLALTELETPFNVDGSIRVTAGDRQGRENIGCYFRPPPSAIRPKSNLPLSGSPVHYHL